MILDRRITDDRDRLRYKKIESQENELIPTIRTAAQHVHYVLFTFFFFLEIDTEIEGIFYVVLFPWLLCQNAQNNYQSRVFYCSYVI